ncbi:MULTISPECIES: excinuclease ABC subunit UvrB [unclassified Oceanispirochaeta]|uniref:excinuclease ABC subunit UvrB n=1 Tax=unclassified Oceanispirochaeta TaxID=2635722 RepID=UPI000E094AA8|nr:MULTISPECIES: excinuclease ABC subunit UvrB [unclassified Oceanispirochaeta]MBF9015030.1 excinuclease ABC subunit B [Oceanispirochaeta sp. M2]NPD71488.1 excinuclease ABC subunit B [Oceanispirochaeta sp. M1]RDG33063.1 excinuclease ABC subunit B [Oceanispirochaeta sp. M1]
MEKFKVVAPFEPAGDQIEAIDKLSQAYLNGEKRATLKGVTGSGKTFTMAKIVENIQKPTLVVSHNKTLAAQLYREFTDFFPNNAVEYFVSYYDYYQPEAYVPSRDLYIEKDSSINDEIDRMRLSATMSLMERQDVLIVSTVSCIYGLGNPSSYKDMRVQLLRGESYNRDDIIRNLISLQYERNDMVLERGKFRVRGDVMEIYPAYLKEAYRVSFNWDEIESLKRFNPVSGDILEVLPMCTVYPAKHFVMPEDRIHQTLDDIRKEMVQQVEFFEAGGQIVEAQRLKTRTEYDLEMMEEMGYCSGIENYSRQLSGREAGERPEVLLDYFPPDFMTIVDESHVTLSQIRAMYEGDRSRKTNLVNFGFRLPSALDNRPLIYSEFEDFKKQMLYVSATPGKEEIEKSSQVVEQVIRPTGLLDPKVEIRPTEGQIEDLYGEIRNRIDQNERILITTLTKRMAEDLTDYLSELGLKVNYLHSEVETIERVEIIRDLRLGKIDILVGINLLREGLDIPEVSLIAIMDADKVGFLRSTTSLIQIIGRASRNVRGQVIMYADKESNAMKEAIAETNRRREIQQKYNDDHGITPASVTKAVQDILIRRTDGKKKAEEMNVHVMKENVNLLDPKQKKKLIKALEKEMLEKAKNMEFEEAAVLRDEIAELKGEKS